MHLKNFIQAYGMKDFIISGRPHLAYSSKRLQKTANEKIGFYPISPILTMIVCMLIYFCIKKLFPKTTQFICGGR